VDLPSCILSSTTIDANGGRSDGETMDWKTYYRAEWTAPGAAEAVREWFRLASETEERPWPRDAVLSFPHTALRYAGRIQCEVVDWLYASGFRRVLALGVLHGGNVEAVRTAFDPSAAADRRRDAFLHAAGGFRFAEETSETPFGSVPGWGPQPVGGRIRIDSDGLLREEFSLDTFLALVALGGDLHARPPLPVFPIYVGMTRDPLRGDFVVAEDLAVHLRNLVDDETAVVATGDLVHYGAYYGPTEGDPGGCNAAALTHWARGEVERTLETALVERDFASAYALCRDRLKNDQREMLPVLASLLDRPRAHLEAFTLSDYAEILEVARPCYVASSLVRFSPKEPTAPDGDGLGTDSASGKDGKDGA
jgi:predicted class III extradiol MEMO1 family dioxygenase